MIRSYQNRSGIVKALDDSLAVLEVSSAGKSILKDRVKSVYNSIVGGDEEDDVRKILSRFEGGDVCLRILHDIISHAEKTGDDVSGALEELSLVVANRSAWRSLCNPDRGHGAGLIVWVVAVRVYSRVFSYEEVCFRTRFYVRGIFKNELISLRNDIIAGTDPNRATVDFLKKVSALPECKKHKEAMISCMMDALISEPGCEGESFGKDKWLDEMAYGSSGKPDGTKIFGRGLYALMAAAMVFMVFINLCEKDKVREERLKRAMSEALIDTVESGKAPMPQGADFSASDVGSQESVRNDTDTSNRMLATFMQEIIKQVDDDIDLTVRICDMDSANKTVDVEAVGEYDANLFGHRKVSVRRRIKY